jgi:heptosyltransferase-2
MLHADCHLFRTGEPCLPHKLRQARCATCSEYDPIAERILIVKLGAMGDVLRTTTCLTPLKARYPHSHVTWITRSNCRAFLERNPMIDRVLTVDGDYLSLLLAEEFDVALGPDADLASASIMRIARAADKKGLMADGRGGVVPLNDAANGWWLLGIDDQLKTANRRTYGEWLYEMFELPGPVARPSLTIGATAMALSAALFPHASLTSGDRVCLNTGGSARWSEKRWKAAHYHDFALLLSEHAPEATIVLVGGPDERTFNRDLLARGGPFVDGGTGNSVEEVGAIMAACTWVLTPDTLGYHIACAVGTPTVCVVGPTAPWELDRYERNVILHADVPCIACYRATCPLPRTCMDLLTPDVVWKSIHQRADFPGLSRGAPRPHGDALPTLAS